MLCMLGVVRFGVQDLEDGPGRFQLIHIHIQIQIQIQIHMQIHIHRHIYIYTL